MSEIQVMWVIRWKHRVSRGVGLSPTLKEERVTALVPAMGFEPTSPRGQWISNVGIRFCLTLSIAMPGLATPAFGWTES